MAKVSLRNIAKRFGSAQLFDGFNLDVADGELLCLLGPSGSGKTTLMRMIAGLEVLDDGDIFVGDREISRLSPRDRHIGMMFQGYALYPHLTVRNNLAYPFSVRHVPGEEADRRVVEVARLLGIEKLLDRYIQQISGGEQQRVAIGRAIVQKPNLYLLDEPISNLDASLRETVQDRGAPPAAPVRRHDDHGDPRSDGRARRGGPHRGARQRGPAANRNARGALSEAGQSVRRRLHRQPAHESAALPLPGTAARARWKGEGFRFPLPAGAEKALPTEARPVVLGFRPEEVEVHRSAQEGAPARDGGDRAFPGRPPDLPAPSRRRGDSSVDGGADESRAERGGVGERGAESDPYFRPGERRDGSELRGADASGLARAAS